MKGPDRAPSSFKLPAATGLVLLRHSGLELVRPLHEVMDEFLGQVVGIEPARALLFRRSDPNIMDGCDVGQRYVLLRFWDDEDGQVWNMPVESEDDRAVFQAIDVTVALYRRSRRSSA